MCESILGDPQRHWLRRESGTQVERLKDAFAFQVLSPVAARLSDHAGLVHTAHAWKSTLAQLQAQLIACGGARAIQIQASLFGGSKIRKALSRAIRGPPAWH